MKWIKWLAALAVCMGVMAIPVFGQESGATNNSISYNGISFSFSSELGDSVNVWNYAGDPAAEQMPGGPQPPQTAFYLYDSTEIENNFGTAAANASVTVYDLNTFGGYDFSQNQVSLLRDILNMRPDLSQYERASAAEVGMDTSLPFLPVYPAGQVLRARTNYVETPTLTGISYITVYRQDVSPFTAGEFIYTIQAVSNTGNFYVSAIQRLNIASFPATLDSVNLDEFMATIDQYFADSIAQINNAAEGEITPSPALLDELVNSLTIGVISSVPGVVSPAPTEAAGNTDPTLAGLAGTWNLVSYGSPDSPIAALPDVPASITLSESGINGNVGCNGFGGRFTYNNDTITFSQLISTMMACEGVMEQESAVLTALNTASTYTVSGDTLTINYVNADGTGGVITFVRADQTVAVSTQETAPGATAGALEGTWNLVSYGAADVQTPALTDTPVTLTFSETGISGTGGCNNVSGAFTFNNNEISVGVLTSTRMACADDVMAQETAVLNALTGATSFTVAEESLQINYTNADGTTGVLVFSRAV